MGEMGDPVELAYLVSVDDLHDICDALNDGTREYRLTCDAGKRCVYLRRCLPRMLGLPSEE